MKPIFLNHAAVNCSMGSQLSQVEDNLFGSVLGNVQDHSFLTSTEKYSPGRLLPLGLVNTDLPSTSIEEENSRNNRMLTSVILNLLPEIERLKERFGPQRIGIVIGTSTSGVSEGEAALIYDADKYSLKDGYRYSTQEFSASVRYLSSWLGTTGPAWVVSTACTSGAKAIASAVRLLNLGVCDAVIAGGVDTLCKMTVAGFSSLLVTTNKQCNPFSVNRDGINIGEAGAFFIVSREESAVRVAGFGETSDAYHISSSDPEGKGAQSAMYLALKNAGLAAKEIDYLNLHGTATKKNDLIESRAVNQVLGSQIACSSTKPLTGHTLAAAGAIEALFCWMLLQRQDSLLPPHIWDAEVDPKLAVLNGLARVQLDVPAKYAMSNSFAFGGNNLSLILARE